MSISFKSNWSCTKPNRGKYLWSAYPEDQMRRITDPEIISPVSYERAIEISKRYRDKGISVVWYARKNKKIEKEI